jgi:hypothetical protein
MNTEFVTELEFTEDFFFNSTVRPICGILEVHAFLPITKGMIIVKKFSTSVESEKFCITGVRKHDT